MIARTLKPLAPLAAAGQLEVIVACNGCTDETAAIARGFHGVTVLELPQPSKTAAPMQATPPPPTGRGCTWTRMFRSAPAPWATSSVP